MRVNESNLKILSIYRIAGYENTKMEIAELMGTVPATPFFVYIWGRAYVKS